MTEPRSPQDGAIMANRYRILSCFSPAMFQSRDRDSNNLN